jgi:hypothetical protein
MNRASRTEDRMPIARVTCDHQRPQQCDAISSQPHSPTIWVASPAKFRRGGSKIIHTCMGMHYSIRSLRYPEPYSVHG